MSGKGRAVVFAYHDVGVRGLSVLMDLGVEVPLVVTHQDDPGENVWFDSVAELARLNGIPVITPEDANTPGVTARVAACQPDLLFSFYYRHLLGAELLGLPGHGAYNLHGSLLPRYRGRAPVNWAVLNGERETGASLHRMELKPDAGALVDQMAVPILSNDTARQVFHKVTCAAELMLMRAVPALLDGSAEERPLELAAGSYFGGRRPEDGRIDWSAPAWDIHNLIRAVAPPYPGAFFDLGGTRLQVLGSHFRGEPAGGQAPRIYWSRGRCLADCRDGKRLHLTTLALDGAVLDESGFSRRFGHGPLALSGIFKKEPMV